MYVYSDLAPGWSFEKTAVPNKVIGPGMERDACIDLFKEKLSLDKGIVIEFLRAVIAGVVAELMEKGEVAVKGLGFFKVAYIPFRKTSQGSIMPPLRKIVFLTRPVADSGLLKIVSSRTGLDATKAQTFYTILCRYFREKKKKKQELSLDGLGAFTTVKGKYIFVPDSTLQEIVNTSFEHLSLFDIGTQQT